MEVQLTALQETQLAEIAQREGRSIEELLSDTASHLLQIEEHRRYSIDRALAQVDRGEFIEEDEMDARFATLLTHS